MTNTIKEEKRTLEDYEPAIYSQKQVDEMMLRAWWIGFMSHCADDNEEWTK
jgi:hypothetical protein